MNPLACMRPDSSNLDYAKRMVALLSQSVDAANLGLERLTSPLLRNQAQIVAVSAEKDMMAFERWVNLNTGPP